MNYNKAIVIGRVTSNIELKTIGSETNVCNFSIATNDYYTKNGQKVEKTEFHNIVAFGKIAQTLAQYSGKGSELMVAGKLQTRSWEHEGKKLYKTEIIVSEFQFGSRKQTEEKLTKNNNLKDSGLVKNEPVGYPDEDINPEDIPF